MNVNFFYLLGGFVIPDNLLPVDIGTPPIIILEMLVISIILRLASMRKPISKLNAKGLLGGDTIHMLKSLLYALIWKGIISLRY